MPLPTERGQCVVLYFAEGWRLMLDAQKRGRFDYQVDAIEAALRNADGSRERAAELLDISPTTLWRKMTRLGIAIESR